MDAPLAPRLSADPWVSSLAPPARAAFIAAAVPRLYAPGQTIYAQGETGQAFFGILGGEVIFTRLSEDGRRSTLAQIGAGNWIGELTFLDDAPRMHDAHAAGEALLALVPVDRMRRLVAAHDAIRDGLVRLLASHTRRLYEAIDQLLVMTPERLLAMRLRERMRTGGAFVPMTQDDIAGMIGVSRQSVNRLLKKLEAGGVVKRGYGGLEILDAAALADLAAGG